MYMEEEMVTHSSIIAWEIPWTEDPGGLEYMRSQRVAQCDTCISVSDLLICFFTCSTGRDRPIDAVWEGDEAGGTGA